MNKKWNGNVGKCWKNEWKIFKKKKVEMVINIVGSKLSKANNPKKKLQSKVKII